MKNFMNLTIVLLSMMQLYVMDSEEAVPVKKRKYTVELEHLCPQVPSQTAEKCTRSFNITKYFQNLYTEEEAKKLNGNPNKLPGKWVDLAECQLNNLETPSISLEIHCYFEGVKEGLVQQNLNFSNTPEDIARMFTELDTQIEQAKNKYVREMLREVKAELEVALDTIGSQGLAVNAQQQPQQGS